MPNLQNITRPVVVVGETSSGAVWAASLFEQHESCQSVPETSLCKTIQADLLDSWWTGALRFECREDVWRGRAIESIRQAYCRLFPGEADWWCVSATGLGHDWSLWRRVFPDLFCIHVCSRPEAYVAQRATEADENIEKSTVDAIIRDYLSIHEHAHSLASGGVPRMILHQERVFAHPGDAAREVLAFSGVPDGNRIDPSPLEADSSNYDLGRATKPPSMLFDRCRDMAQSLGYETVGAGPVGEDRTVDCQEVHDVLLAAPWRHETELSFKKVPGMLRVHERYLLYYLARDYYSGRGAIVDAGAFAGASAFSFAAGLEENSTVRKKSRRIHSFDKWLADEPYLVSFLERFVPSPELGSSFDDFFRANLEDKIRHVVMHKGDFLKQLWDGSPIEILFVDIAKTRDLNSQIMRSFYSHLIPERSLLIHQDYHHPVLPYIHVTMEALSDHFEIVDEKVDDSIVFRLTSEIPRQVLDRVAEYRFTAEEQVALIDGAITRLRPACRPHVQLARAFLLYLLYGADRLTHELELLDREYPEDVDEHWHNYRHKMVPQSAGLTV